MIATTWVCVVVLPAVAVAVASLRARQSIESLRAAAVVGAAVMLAVSLVPLAVPSLRGGAIGATCGLLRIDGLSAFLVPLAAGLWLLAVAVTPRQRLDRRGLGRSALATLTTTACFLTESPYLLAVLWIVSAYTFLAAIAGAQHRRAWRLATVHLGTSSVAFVVGVALLGWTATESAGIWLLVAAALIRKGIFPFHAWIPDVFERGRLGPAVLFCAPQVGAYSVVVLVLPRAAPEVLHTVAILALVTAAYGAALALVQSDARRASGYLFVSQSALVMAGLDCTSETALTGALVLWISSAVAFAGFARALLVLEARRGRLSLAEHHGGFERMPTLALSFLAMGFACTGFPGTLGFVGSELLLSGATAEFPLLGFSVVLAGAATGMAVLRMYFALFCGREDRSFPLPLSRREAWAFASVAVFLVLAGLAPRAIVTSQTRASQQIIDARAGWHTGNVAVDRTLLTHEE